MKVNKSMELVGKKNKIWQTIIKVDKLKKKIK